MSPILSAPEAFSDKTGSRLRVSEIFHSIQSDPDAIGLAVWILADQAPVRLQIQLHKLLWGEAAGR